MNKFCKIRKDLVEQGYLVPVGETYVEQIDEMQLFEYRWDKDQFQIKTDGKFQNAESIDFEFDY